VSRHRALVAITILCAPRGVHAQAKSSELAEALSNPVAPLLGVQLQSDLEWSGGPASDGSRYTVTLQPVIPFALTDDWNVISRSNLAFAHQSNLVAVDAHATGLANTTESLFLSPKRTRVSGLTWGLGPIVALPATNPQLGTGAVGLGPTFAIIHTVDPVVYGILVEQVWSFGGSQVYLQPQVAWTLGAAGTSLRARSETTHEWHTRSWTVPVIVDVAQVVDIADRSFEVSFGPIVYVERPEDAPRWGLRATITLAVP
jgi:hypothetical protein